MNKRKILGMIVIIGLTVFVAIMFAKRGLLPLFESLDKYDRSLPSEWPLKIKLCYRIGSLVIAGIGLFLIAAINLLIVYFLNWLGNFEFKLNRALLFYCLFIEIVAVIILFSS